MSDRITNLKREGKITEIEYHTYLLFAGNDIGVIYLKKMSDSIVREEAVQPTGVLFAWHDGRRSVWRDILFMIDKVEMLLKKGDKQHDGSSQKRNSQ